jgi:hypothetical protein
MFSGSSPTPPAKPSDLQFDTAEPMPAAPGAPASATHCVGCGQPIVDQYYAVGDKLVCPACRERYMATTTGGSRVARLARATLFGILTGLAGAAVWYGIRKITGYEIGLVAIVVGLFVGGAVRAGSRGRGGRGYQILAVVLTYASICANYMPDVFKALYDKFDEDRQAHVTPATVRHANASATRDSNAADAEDSRETTASTQPVAVTAADGTHSSVNGRRHIGVGRAILAVIILIVIVFAVSLAAPFLAGMQNIIGLLIIGFALWQAWKMNARAKVAMAGPYSLAGGPVYAPGMMPSPPNWPGGPGTA